MPLLSLIASLQDTPVAPPPTDEGGGSMFSGMLIPMVLIMGVFYFIVMVPEKKNRKRRETMLSALKKNDRVLTTAGMYGTVAQVQDDTVTVQVADGVRIKFARSAIQSVEEVVTESEAKSS